MSASNYNYDLSIIYTTGADANNNSSTLERLDKQFKKMKRIQIIIVNNSKDDAEIDSAVNNIATKHRDNVLVINKPDATIYESYEDGFGHIEGKWVTCVNAGDRFDDSYCKDAIDFLKEKHVKARIGMVSKKVFDGIAEVVDQYSQKMTVKNEVIDLNVSPKTLPIFMNGSFVRKEIFDEIKFDGSFTYDAEKKFFFELLAKENLVAAMGKISFYCYEPRQNNFRLYVGVYDREWYYDSIERFLVPTLQMINDKYGNIPMSIQYCALGFIMDRLEANIDNRNRHVLSQEEGMEYIGYVSKILQFIEDKHVLNMHEVPYYTNIPNNMKMLLQVKYNDFDIRFSYFFKRKELNVAFRHVTFFSVNNLRMNILFMEYVNGNLEIDASFPDYFDLRDVNVYAHFNGKRYDLRYEENYSITKFFGCSAYKRYNFHLTIPLNPKLKFQNLEFRMEYLGEIYLVAPEYKSHTSRLSGALKNAYWKFDNYIAYHDSNSIIIKKYSRHKVIISELKIFKELLMTKNFYYYKILGARLLYWMYRPFYKNKKIWLFYDKIYKGGDSSEYMYKYAMSMKDGIKKYYLLDRKCPDFKKLKKEGYKPLVRGSIKHRMVFFNADIVIVSNSTVFAFNNFSLKVSSYFRGIFDFHVACVQHGMSIQKIAVAQKRLRDNTRLYFCASKYEIENLSKPIYNYVGYDALRLTGVPRYDGLVDEAEKQIMISPTWRMQSARLVTKNEGVERDYNPEFIHSEYFKVFNSLINDERLIDAAKKFGYRIKYVLHPIVSPQVDDFDKNDYVDIVPAVGDMSYEEMFRKSSLMVTDYSGIQFDFAYMRKPLVYLHHDDIPQHYEEGTYHYDTMAFGEICHNNDELIELLCEYMENGCVMKDEYRRRADDFFEYSDHNNCERIYKEMITYQHDKIDVQKGR